MRCSRSTLPVYRSILALTAIAMTIAPQAAQAAATWSAPQILNDPGDWNNNANELKDPQIVAAKGGGFHVVYTMKEAGDVRYRRVNADMTMGTHTPVYNGSFSAGVQVGELNDGTVQVVWERWGEPGGPEVGVRKLANNGSTLGPVTTISTSNGNAKFPMVTGYGTGNDGKAVMSYWNSSTKEMRFATNNGTTWGSDLGANRYPDIEYRVTGMARSPVDGSVWRSYGTSNGNSTYNLHMVNFNPATQTWGTPVNIANNVAQADYPSRLQLAVNSAGKVFVAWDSGNSTSGKIYTPGVGFNAEMPLWTNQSFFGNVAAVPGTSNDWYVFNSYGQDFPMIRPIVNGVLDPVTFPAEYPGDGYTNNTFIPNIKGSIDENGRMAVIWENWAGNQKPQVMFSYRDTLVPEPTTGALLAAAVSMVALRRRRA